jgi:diacylglycerol O-acyltransferase / wax synthase
VKTRRNDVPCTRLTGLDVFMLGTDRGSTYNHTLKIAILDPASDPGGWSFSQYRTLLEHHLSLAPLLRRRYLRTPLGLHRPIWVDDPDFSLDAHLHRVACPAPGGMAEFCTLVEQIYSHPLDHARPLWQIWVVEGLEGGRVAVVALLHHAYSDGAGVRGILEGVTSTTQIDARTTAPPEWSPAPLPSPLRQVVWAVRDLPPLVRAVPPALRAVRDRRRLERRFAEGRGGAMPSLADRRQPQPFAGALARARRFACESFSLEEMREVRAALGSTVNDVFLSCVAGSVREFLAGRGSPPTAPVVGTMPFLTKPLSERPAQGGNFSSGDDVWLHVEIADPVERLRATSASARVTKDHFKAVAAADPLLVLADLMPGWLMSAILRFDERTKGRFTPAYNIVMSNVAGPAKTLYVDRWRVESWFSTGQLIPGITVNFTGWSYAEQFNLCVLSGSPTVPDAWELMAGFRKSLDELLAVARAAEPRDRAHTSGGVACPA